MRVDVGDIELHVHEKGAGRPFLALHGGAGVDGSVWFPALDPLADEGWRVLAVDQRANGLSDGGDPAPGTVGEPAAVHAVHERPAVFEPERLRAQVTASWEREATVQTAEEAKQLLHDQYPFHVADPEGPLVQWLIDNDRIVYRPEVLRHFAAGGDYGLVDQRDALRSFARPVLVLSGAEDRTTPAASAHDLAHAIPGAQEIVIPNAAHPLPDEQPEAFLGALRAFLARV